MLCCKLPDKALTSGELMLLKVLLGNIFFLLRKVLQLVTSHNLATNRKSLFVKFVFVP